jgi:hypothetical protein
MLMLGMLMLGMLMLGLATGGTARAQDLSRYKLSFQDDFQKLDASAYGPSTRWIAHTPWRGDFGDDVFGNPGPGGPFSAGAEGLHITASKGADGRWQAGLLSSMDMDGQGQTGFAQEYGYFEIRAKLPCGAGVWPAFWLVGKDLSHGTSEIDVFEYYGHDDAHIHTTEHLWVNGKDTLHDWTVAQVPAGSLCSQFNDYGVMITPAATSYYLNGAKFWETPTPDAYKQPMYLLIDLAVGGGWPDGRLASPQVMDVAYVRVYQAEDK